MRWTRFRDGWIGYAIPDGASHAYFWYRSRKRGVRTVVCVWNLGTFKKGVFKPTGATIATARYEWAKEGVEAGRGWWAGPIPEPAE